MEELMIENKNKMIKLLTLIVSQMIQDFDIDADSQINVVDSGELLQSIPISEILTKALVMSEEY